MGTRPFVRPGYEPERLVAVPARPTVAEALRAVAGRTNNSWLRRRLEDPSQLTAVARELLNVPWVSAEEKQRIREALG